MSLSELLEKRISEVEAIIFSYVPKDVTYQQTVSEAMEYSLRAGGKRLRPMIMLEVFRMFGGKGNVVEPFMAALEMIHTYSLVHDDLPCMDNDALRRGKPSCWAKYGEAMATLTGDSLLNFAYETAGRAIECQSDMDSMQRAARAFLVLSNKAGIYGMLGGQTADVEAEKKHIDIDAKRLDFIHELKTGALLEAAFMIGGILAGADDSSIKKLQRAALCVGVAFQIQDDILDVEGDESLLGKPIGSDEELSKQTYVTLYGIEESKKASSRLVNEAMEILEDLNGSTPGDGEFLLELVKSLIGRNY